MLRHRRPQGQLMFRLGWCATRCFINTPTFVFGSPNQGTMTPETEGDALPLGQSAAVAKHRPSHWLISVHSQQGMRVIEGPSWLPMSHWTATSLFQSIQPTANLDRTDDAVYHNVMTLVEAVLELKNRLSQLPPEEYVVVVKVIDRVGVDQGDRDFPS